jgi:hypothetical protein
LLCALEETQARVLSAASVLDAGLDANTRKWSQVQVCLLDLHPAGSLQLTVQRKPKKKQKRKKKIRKKTTGVKMRKLERENGSPRGVAAAHLLDKRRHLREGEGRMSVAPDGPLGEDILDCLVDRIVPAR